MGPKVAGFVEYRLRDATRDQGFRVVEGSVRLVPAYVVDLRDAPVHADAGVGMVSMIMLTQQRMPSDTPIYGRCRRTDRATDPRSLLRGRGPHDSSSYCFEAELKAFL